MSTTGRDQSSRSIAPVRRRGQAPEPSFEDAEVARGQSDALLGALGRMQLRLDVLAREQAETLDRVLVSLERVEARLAALERQTPTERI